MAKPSQEVYRCPSCGTLASVEAGEERERVCAKCGFEFRQPVRIAPRSVSQEAVSAGGFVQRDVSARRRHSERVEPVVPLDILAGVSTAEEKSEGGKGEEVVSDDGHKKVIRRTKKRRRTRVAPLLFLGGWAIVVMLTVILVRNQSRASKTQDEAPRDVVEQQERAKERAMKAFCNQHHDACRRALDGFLAASTSAARTQFVRDPKRLAPVMAEYYKGTMPWVRPADAPLATKSMNLFMRGEERAIEMVVGLEKPTAAHPDREVAFVREGDRWVIEWESLVRYSEVPWQLFVEKVAKPEGVFRVYMRKSTVASETEQPVIKVQFLPPRDDELLWRQDSDWVVVGLNSDIGKRIEQIMEEGQGEPELGESMFGKGDPEELYRVRVTLAWEPGEDGREYLKLREVQAGNWYGPGFEEDFGGEAGSAPAPLPETDDGTPDPPEDVEPPAPEDGN